MDNKNNFIAILLIAIVLIGFSYYNSQQNKNLQTQSAQQINQQNTSNKNRSNNNSEVLASKINNQNYDNRINKANSIFNQSDSIKATPILLKNKNILLEISPKGGYISKVELPQYKSYQNFHNGINTPLLLFDSTTAATNFQIKTVNGMCNTKELYFSPSLITDSSVVMSIGTKAGDSLIISYKLIPKTYMVNVAISTKGNIFSDDKMTIQWVDKIRQIEKGYKFENQYSTLTYKNIDGDTHKLSEISREEKNVKNPVNWIAFKNQYFSSVIISGNKNFSDVALTTDTCGIGSGFVKNYTAELSIPLTSSNSKPTTFQYYFGPNKYRYLQGLEKYRLSPNELGLENLVYLGWPLFKWINRYFTIYVFDFLTQFGLNMGVVLLLITLLLKVIVYPTTKKSFMSAAKMRLLRPELETINKKYPKKEDIAKRQNETMMLYRNYGVSPVGGCLPMLVQAPLWIAMFNFVPNAFELRQQGFLWADDLSTYDSFFHWQNPVWGLGTHLSLFCLLFCITNVVYSWLMMKQQQDSVSPEQASQMKVMQYMMFLMPIFFFFMFNSYSSGLNYYYFISLLTTALTMWYLRFTLDEKKLKAKLDANFLANKNDPNRKPMGLAGRLQALQQKQEEKLKKQQYLRNK